MTPGRRAALAICVPIAVAGIGWGAFNVVALVGTGQYSFSSPVSVTSGTLTASVSAGDVTLVPGASARLAGTVTYSLIRPSLTADGSGVSFHCVVPTGMCDMSSTLTVPPSASAVDLSSSAGDLTVNAGTASKLTLKTDAGDISASGISASDVTVRSVAGDITLTFSQVPHNVTVDDTVGDVSIELPAARYRFDVADSIGTVSDPGSDDSASNVVSVTSRVGDVSISES